MFKLSVCLIALAGLAAAQQNNTPGRAVFDARCAICHGGNGAGNERGPSLLNFVRGNNDDAIMAMIRNGSASKNMPPQQVPAAELSQLLTFLHTLAPPAAARGGGRGRGRGPRTGTAKLRNGQTLTGLVRNESSFDMQLQTPDGKLHRLIKEGDFYTEAPLEPKVDWAHYDGSYTQNRHTAMTQINPSNVKNLGLRWMFPIANVPRIEATPVVLDGIMYVTAVNQAYAIDATTGRQIWQYRQPPTEGVLGESGGGANRGVAVSGDKVFMMTDHAHIIALNRSTGEKIWDTEMGDYHENYASSGSPLIVGDLVIAGIAGGDEGARGFLDAYKADTGERAWRFWTIPARGEKLAEGWQGTALEHGCGATWLSGAYDPQLDLLYWTVGNPCPDYNGEERKGDNLYTNSILALRPKTGELVWYYQTTPHDTHDWDAIAPTLLLDEPFEGQPRKLMVQANRNGFFYVLDRTNGKVLRATPYVDLTWATGIGADGRPMTTPNWESSPQGNRVCPAAGGGANWMSTSFDPSLGYFFVTLSEGCAIYRSAPQEWRAGTRYFGGSPSGDANTPTRRLARALDLKTGKKVWEFEQQGGFAWSGTMSTASGLVFFGEGSGAIVALDSKTGAELWHSQLNARLRASPMTYMVGGKQFIVIASNTAIMAFALPD